MSCVKGVLGVLRRTTGNVTASCLAPAFFPGHWPSSSTPLFTTTSTCLTTYTPCSTHFTYLRSLTEGVALRFWASRGGIIHKEKAKHTPPARPATISQLLACLDGRRADCGGSQYTRKLVHNKKPKKKSIHFRMSKCTGLIFCFSYLVIYL